LHRPAAEGVFLRVLRCVYAGRIDTENALLVIHPDHTRASKLVPLIEHHAKHGFLVVPTRCSASTAS
jgi:hypothetical protein